MSYKLLNDRGSILILGIGLFVVVVGMCTVAANVTSLWVMRHGLDSAADGAALSAAQAIDVKYIYRHGVTNPIHLDSTAAKKRVKDYVREANLSARFTNFRVRSVAVEGTSVYVELQAQADLPFSYLVPNAAQRVISGASANLELK